MQPRGAPEIVPVARRVRDSRARDDLYSKTRVVFRSSSGRDQHAPPELIAALDIARLIVAPHVGRSARLAIFHFIGIAERDAAMRHDVARSHIDPGAIEPVENV